MFFFSLMFSPPDQVRTPRSLSCALKVQATFVNIRDLTRNASSSRAVWEEKLCRIFLLNHHLPLTLASVFVDTRISRIHAGDTERSVLILDTGIVPHWSSMVPMSLMSLSLLPNGRLSLVVMTWCCALIGWCPLISPELDFCARIMKVSWQW